MVKTNLFLESGTDEKLQGFKTVQVLENSFADTRDILLN